MLKILDQNFKTQAIIDKILSAKLYEEINREFGFEFSTIIDGDKSQYLNYQHMAQVDENYFDIAYTQSKRNSDGTLIIDVDCDHVSYRLSEEGNIIDSFIGYGTGSELLSTLLADTGFTVGTVDFTDPILIAINEKTTRRAVLLAIAAAYAGELKFDKFQISLLTRRGVDRGVQFRHRKNNISVGYTIDNRTKIDGFPAVSYEVEVAELEFAEGYGSDEHFELGDTVQVIDEGLNLDIPARIVRHEYDPFQRMKGDVTIANFIEDLYDDLTRIETTTVAKDKDYNDCSIGPKYGFVATKRDKKARTLMNGTDGFKIQKGDGSGDNWVDVVFIDTDGNAVYKGKVSAAIIEGSTVNGGTINGAFFNGGSIYITTDAHVGNNLYLGDLASAGQTKYIYFHNTVNIHSEAGSNALVIEASPLNFIGRINGPDPGGGNTKEIACGGTWDFTSSIAVIGLETKGYLRGTGISGSFTTVDGKTVTVLNGVITGGL